MTQSGISPIGIPNYIKAQIGIIVSCHKGNPTGIPEAKCDKKLNKDSKLVRNLTRKFGYMHKTCSRNSLNSGIGGLATISKTSAETP